MLPFLSAPHPIVNFGQASAQAPLDDVVAAVAPGHREREVPARFQLFLAEPADLGGHGAPGGTMPADGRPHGWDKDAAARSGTLQGSVIAPLVI